MENEASIEQLVRVAQHGDQRAFAELVALHFSMVHGLVLSVVGDWAAADDVTQEVFISVWTKLDTLKHPAAFPVWLRQVARTSAVDWLRSAAFRERLARAFAAHPLPGTLDPDPASVVARKECLNRVGEDLKGLSPRLREALVLYYIEGGSVSECARALGIREEAMRKRLQLGCERLRDSYQEREQATLEQLLPYAARPYADRVGAALAMAPMLNAGRKLPSANPIRIAYSHLVTGGSLGALRSAGLAAPVVRALLVGGLLCASALAASGMAYRGVNGGIHADGQLATGLSSTSERVPRMGIIAYLQQNDPQWPNTALVLQTRPGEPAYEAGMREGDRTVCVNGKRVFKNFQNDPSLGIPKSDGLHTRFTVVRPQGGKNGKEIEIDVVWGH